VPVADLSITYLNEIMFQIDVTIDKWILIFPFPKSLGIESGADSNHRKIVNEWESIGGG